MNITGTFIDEISHDIPHQNWGIDEWRTDFKHMKSIGIDTVILIRAGYRKQLTYPSKYLIEKNNCYAPYTDLLEMFLSLADEMNMSFYLGLYDSGKYWDTQNLRHEIKPNRYVIEEVWREYGSHPSFKGWYMSMEFSKNMDGAIETVQTLSKIAKSVSSGLPCLISPWIDGVKSVSAFSSVTSKTGGVQPREHEKIWDEILSGLSGSIDILAFQDGHVEIEKLQDFLSINAALAKKYGMSSWSNSETFDRDMPIKFLPIKFEKLRRKIEMVKPELYDKVITFEFSHFMSPQSAYLQAKHLYKRYMEYINV